MGIGGKAVTESKMSTVVRPNFATKGTDNITDIDELEGLLSPFQREKLTYFFKQFFDFNEDGKIDAADFEGLNERLRKMGGGGRTTRSTSTWSITTGSSLSVSSSRCWQRGTRRVWRRGAGRKLLLPARWLHMWARMCKGSAGIDDFPIWVQLIPRVIFNVIWSKMRVDYITRESLRNFYE